MTPTPTTSRRYQDCVAGTYKHKNAHAILASDDLESIREYVSQQRVPCEIRTTKTGALMKLNHEKP